MVEAMTDLEITKLCWDAMGYKLINGHMRLLCESACAGEYRIDYNPLHDDAQAMALVKKFRLKIEPWETEFEPAGQEMWSVNDEHGIDSVILNRAICECVAKMQRAKHATV